MAVVARRIAVTGRVSIAGVRARGAKVRTRAIGVDRWAFKTGAIIIMVGGVGIAAAIVAIVVRATAIGVPAGHCALLIGRIRREVAGTGIGRALIDVIVVLHSIG